MKTSIIPKTARYLGIVIFYHVLRSGCTSTTTDPQPVADQYLVSSKDVATLTKDQLVTQASAINPIYAVLLRQGVSVVKIVYNTKNWDGSAIQGIRSAGNSKHDGCRADD